MCTNPKVNTYCMVKISLPQKCREDETVQTRMKLKNDFFFFLCASLVSFSFALVIPKTTPLNEMTEIKRKEKKKKTRKWLFLPSENFSRLFLANIVGLEHTSVHMVDFPKILFNGRYIHSVLIKLMNKFAILFFVYVRLVYNSA